MAYLEEMLLISMVKAQLNKRSYQTLFELVLLLVIILLISRRDSFAPQRVIDSGLLYSGLIDYKTDTFMYKVLTESITILNPLAGLLLFLGIEILQVSFIFQFINLSLMAFSTFFILKNLHFNSFVSLVIPSIFIYSLPDITQVFVRNYSTQINSVHTYGQFGLSLSIVVIALFLNKKFIYLGIIIPVFYLVHIGWASFITLIILFVILSIKGRIPIFNYSAFLKGFIASTIFFIPIIVFITNTYKSDFVSNPSYDLAKDYKEYITNWDFHRSFTFDIKTVLINFSFLLLIIIIQVVYKNFDHNELIFLKILSFSIFLSTSFYILNDYVLGNRIIIFSALMPSRFFNLQAYFSIIVVLVFLKIPYLKILQRLNFFSIKVSNSMRLIINFFIFVTLVTIYLINPGWGIKTDSFNFRPVSFYERMDFSNVCAKLDDLNSGVVLTYGEISKFVPLNCLKPILIDTTQIDSAPYVPETISYLSAVISEIYGVPFESRKEFNTFYRSDMNSTFRPSGTIESFYPKSMWPLRSEERWKFLGCKFGFQTIVTDSHIHLNIDSFTKLEDFNIYTLNPNDCD
jgi:hypothetical protein